MTDLDLAHNALAELALNLASSSPFLSFKEIEDIHYPKAVGVVTIKYCYPPCLYIVVYLLTP